MLQNNGVTTPKVLLLSRTNQGVTTQELVFNITPQSFSDLNLFPALMRAISWYLPRHYALVGMAEESIGQAFMPL